MAQRAARGCQQLLLCVLTEAALQLRTAQLLSLGSWGSQGPLRTPEGWAGVEAAVLTETSALRHHRPSPAPALSSPFPQPTQGPVPTLELEHRGDLCVPSARSWTPNLSEGLMELPGSSWRDILAEPHCSAVVTDALCRLT